MEKYISPDVALAGFGLLGLISILLAIIVSIKKLVAKPRHHESIPRGEYEKDERGRAEQIEAIATRCTLIEAAAVKNTEKLIESMTQLRVELAMLTAFLRYTYPGETEWRSPPPAPPTQEPNLGPPPLPRGSSLSPRRSQGSVPASST
jgi:hypothetical protein